MEGLTMRRLRFFLFILLTVTLSATCVFGESELLRRFNDGLEKEREGDYISAVFIYQEILEKNRYFIDAKIALARTFYKTGNLQESEVILREALKQEDRNVEIINLLGRVLISLQRYEDAEAVFKEALSIEPVNIETRYGIADLYRVQGDYEEAIDIYNDLLKIYPQDVWTYIHLGTSYTELGEMRKAGGFFRKAVSLDSTSPWTHVNLARHYYRMGIIASKSEKASSEGDTASEKYFDAAIYEAETARKIDGTVVDSYEILASVYFYTKEYRSALEHYRVLLDKGLNDPAAGGSVQLYEMGYCYEMLGMLEDAEGYYRKSLAMRIDDEVTRFRLENIVLAMKRERLKDPLRIELSDEHLFKARSLMEKFIMDKAYLHYKRAVQLDPLNPQKRLEIAEHLRTRGLYELYLFELKDIIRDTLDIDTIDLNDRIEIYSDRVSKNLPARWKVHQYEDDPSQSGFIPRTRITVAVFDSFSHDWMPRENVVHRRLSKTVAQMLSWMLTCYPKIEVISHEEEVTSPEEALKAAKIIGAEYYITGTIEEKEDSLKVAVEMNSGFNGKAVKSFTAYYTGNEKLFNTAFSIAGEIHRSVPTRGLVARMSADRVLINLGKVHDVEEGMKFLIFREKGLVRNPETGEYVYDPDISLGKLTVTAIDEMVAEGTYEFYGMHNRVNVYDSVILTTDGKE
jgi:tetratricopeptide (TPR) repeat protein